jgi:hypothetical protein
VVLRTKFFYLQAVAGKDLRTRYHRLRETLQKETPLHENILLYLYQSPGVHYGKAAHNKQGCIANPPLCKVTSSITTPARGLISNYPVDASKDKQVFDCWPHSIY